MAAEGAQRSDLARDGFVLVPALLDETWCRRLHAAIERCRASRGPHYGVLSPRGRPLVDSDLFRWADDRDVRALTHDSPLPVLASQLLGEATVVLIEDQWFASEAGATTASPWHQDQPYYRVDRPFLTIWVTLDDIGATSSLRVVERSHLGPLFSTVEFSASSPTIDARGGLPPVPDVDAADRSGLVRSWALRAGDAVALDSRVLHATGNGPSPVPFRRISTRWAATDTRYVVPPHGTASFWDIIDHGRHDGDHLACDAFPLVTATHPANAAPTTSHIRNGHGAVPSRIPSAPNLLDTTVVAVSRRPPVQPLASRRTT